MNRFSPNDKYEPSVGAPDYFKEFLKHYNEMFESLLRDTRKMTPVQVTLKDGVDIVIPTEFKVSAVIPLTGRVDYLESFTPYPRQVKVKARLKKESILSSSWNSGLIEVSGNLFKSGDMVRTKAGVNEISSVINQHSHQVIELGRGLPITRGDSIGVMKEEVSLLLIGEK